MKIELLKDYFFSALCALIIIGCCESLVTQKFRPYIKYISGLFVLITVAMPLFNSLSQLTDNVSGGELDFFETTQPSYTLYANEYAKSLERAVSDFICERTQLSLEDFDISVKIDSSDISSIKTELITVKVLKKCDSASLKRQIELWIAVPTEVICEYE